jgi:transposase InsO family protein
MEERIKFIARAAQRGANKSALCREFGISRQTGYRWLNRYREAGSLKEVGELSRRPKRVPSKTPVGLEERVVKMRLNLGWGAKILRELLLQEGIDMKVATINRIIKRNGLVHPKDSRSRASKRFERASPNELWQIDFKGDYKAGRGRCYPFSILDDHSRYLLGLFALNCQTGSAVSACLVKTFEEYGLPDAMLMDHGIPWWGNSNPSGLTRLSVALIKQGIKLYFSGIRHPQTQGKVERFHRTLDERVRHYGHPKSMAGWHNLLDYILNEYNYIRPHESLGMETPAQHHSPSKKAYNPDPPEWEYPSGAMVKRLNSQGCMDYNYKRYFVCEALAGEKVQFEILENKLVVSFRHMYIREINTKTGKTVSLLKPKIKHGL